MSDPTPLSGLLVIDKPSGPTSHDVVDRIRKVYETRRVGHAGTLDPAATGILLVGLGRATRLLTFLQALAKTYRAAAKFGVRTSTQDAEGQVVSTVASTVSRAQLESAAAAFSGEIRQVPPMVSAVKVKGEPLYKAARRGEEVDRKARSVRVYDFEVEDFDFRQQVAKIFVRCSSGTYVRTLASDLGDALEVGAHLISLRRLSIGSFGEDESVRLEELEDIGLKASLERVIPMSQAMRDFPRVNVDDSAKVDVSHGKPLGLDLLDPRVGELEVISQNAPGPRPPHEAGMTAGIPVAVLDQRGDLIAIYRRTSKVLKPEAVLI